MLVKIKFIVKSQYGAKDEERMVTERCAAQFERAGLIAKEEKEVPETKEEKQVIETKAKKAKITKSPR
jgi:hypothetical protein